MWVSRDLKAPDEGSWVALVEITAEGETEIIGYLSRSTFDELGIIGGYLHRLWTDHINEAQNTEREPS